LIQYKERIVIVALNTIAAMYEINQGGYSKEITYLPKSLKSKPHFNVFVTAYDYPNKEELIKRYDEIFLEC
jgi:hypothetical protein